MIYILFFSVSSFFVFLSDYFYKIRVKILMILAAIIAISLLALLSGMRDIEIGTDTAMYSSYFTSSINNNFSQIYNFLHINNNVEIGYVVLNYLISRITNNIFVFQTICSYIIEINVYLALILLRKRINITLGWIIFCLLFYANTLNILRQSIALSCILLSYSLMYTHKFALSILAFIFGILMHVSTIIAIIPLMMGFIFQKIKKGKNFKKIYFIYTITLFFIPVLINRLYLMGFFSEKYTNYFSIIGQQNSLIFSYAIRTPFIILIIYLIATHKFKNKMDIWLNLIVLGEFILLPIQQVNSILGRVLLFFGVAKIFAYSEMMDKLTENSSLRKFLNIVMVIFLIIIFVEQTFVLKNNQIYPYSLGVRML